MFARQDRRNERRYKPTEWLITPLCLGGGGNSGDHYLEFTSSPKSVPIEASRTCSRRMLSGTGSFAASSLCGQSGGAMLYETFNAS